MGDLDAPSGFDADDGGDGVGCAGVVGHGVGGGHDRGLCAAVGGDGGGGIGGQARGPTHFNTAADAVHDRCPGAGRDGREGDGVGVADASADLGGGTDGDGAGGAAHAGPSGGGMSGQSGVGVSGDAAGGGR
ncbi:BatC protein [Actinosynnema sp. NPDC053489]|uniref:BatC protein n=1 Tax=Actinosynnema sp. NPDC053489 TaxID=3363916 RepID=UPI0037C8EA49